MKIVSSRDLQEEYVRLTLISPRNEELPVIPAEMGKKDASSLTSTEIKELPLPLSPTPKKTTAQKEYPSNNEAQSNKKRPSIKEAPSSSEKPLLTPAPKEKSSFQPSANKLQEKIPIPAKTQPPNPKSNPVEEPPKAKAPSPETAAPKEITENNEKESASTSPPPQSVKMEAERLPPPPAPKKRVETPDDEMFSFTWDGGGKRKLVYVPPLVFPGSVLAGAEGASLEISIKVDSEGSVIAVRLPAGGSGNSELDKLIREKILSLRFDTRSGAGVEGGEVLLNFNRSKER